MYNYIFILSRFFFFVMALFIPSFEPKFMRNMLFVFVGQMKKKTFKSNCKYPWRLNACIKW